MSSYRKQTVLIKTRIMNSMLFFLTAFLITFSFSGCTVTQTWEGAQKILVTKDDPVFDKRFQEVAFAELNLENFWVSNPYEGTRENIMVHNNTFVEITESIKDGVVNIYTRRLEEKETRFGISPSDLLPFKIPIVSNLLDIVPFRVPIPFETTGYSLGSGFIINEQGYILTNAHVIHNATDIRVVLSEGKIKYPAKIIGVDRLTDSALIKMSPETMLTVLPLGDSDKLKMAEMVLAIGNPLGLRHTVTSGLISAKERIAPHINDKHVDFLQTDSAINPGSSGGPLINLYGEVVGINTAIAQQAQLIGFAVPINTIKEVMPLLVLGRTERGWFGARAGPLNIKNAVELGFPVDTYNAGILVMEVEKDSPAEISGLKHKDIITKINGKSFESFAAFRRKLMGFFPGKKIQLTIFRDGETRQIESTLVEKIEKTEELALEDS
ncbi:MAG: trypsin-like peptidase domain-containing protein [Nitrospinota bacterium]|nr:trypsin-like peptidase domain-containing protein [Nitrospinota bacterium]